ncbi:c-type cytochrome [Shewanella sedimentimangrovi]|uniref:Cytochrome c n=1 Tax=Shewanella sedimentimangrovi TaxID=2814293 RepID=A0ABX7R1N9_9GAMM|nr:cytochrome c [Shewanella sedimentimangrovi]QSX37727.1 cytochrome c [Shewanella sedimentimangrovi]
MSNKLLGVLLSLLSFSALAEVDADHEAGRQLYNYRCYYCHGYSGDAKTLAASWMDPKPANFAAMSLGDRTQEQMEAVVHQGIEGTAMMSFDYFLSDTEVTTVVRFIRKEFMENKAANTHYHTAEAGWPNHERYQAAFPFATGELPVDLADDKLNNEQRAGKVLYLKACISCHDQGRVESQGPIWRTESISYPRNNYSFTEFDGVTGASVFLKHDRPEIQPGLSESAKKGQLLWDGNCAFCHAKDGTGHNWIGSFLEYKPRDLTSSQFMGQLTRAELKERIKSGVVNTSMPAWRDVLTEEQLEQLIDYIEQAFHPLKAEGGTQG